MEGEEKGQERGETEGVVEGLKQERPLLQQKVCIYKLAFEQGHGTHGRKRETPRFPST